MGSHTSLHRLPGMLLLGSTGRNSGKTEFACGVLNRFCRNHTLIGLKVTIIRDNDGSCPRGGEGCGVCTSLEGPFDITEETNREGIKDTSRMLRTGADRVFWLRVRSACVEEGLKALLEIIGPDAVTVCESNSLRHTVEPGLFVMVRNSRTTACKPTALSVMEYADRIVTSDGKRFSTTLEDLSLSNGVWVLNDP
jgi:hypothetical protein